MTMLPKPHPGVTLAAFTHLVQTCANGVKFAHQLLCNLKISMLLKAFLQGIPQRVPQPQQEIDT
jgi:hypothetical protein